MFPLLPGERTTDAADGGERYRELFESLAVGVVVQAADGTIVSCNPAAECILGLSFDQMIGRTSTDPRWRALRVDGSPFPGEAHPAMVALRTGLPVRDETMGVARPDGSRTWISINAQPLSADAHGRPRGVITSFTDITALIDARRRAEELGEWLKLATQAGGIGLIEWHLDRGEATVDAVAAALLSLPPADGPVPVARLLAHVEPADRDAMLERLGAAGPARDPRPGTAFWVHPPGAARRRIASRTVVHRDAAGRAHRVIGALYDTTAAFELKASTLARVAAEGASEAKSRLLARVSHDLRTPLNAVLGFAQLLALEPSQPTGAIREQAGQIVDAGRHLLALVSDLIDASAADSGALPMRIEPVALRPAIDAALALVAQEAASVDVALLHEPGPPVSAAADPTRLRQVLCNLAINAIRYNRRGGSVRVRAYRDGGTVRVEVADTGPGLAPEDLDRVFEPFRRGGAPSLTGTEGTGLGLSIGRGLVELMGGRLTVRSERGRGSVFSVELPASG